MITNPFTEVQEGVAILYAVSAPGLFAFQERHILLVVGLAKQRTLTKLSICRLLCKITVYAHSVSIILDSIDTYYLVV